METVKSAGYVAARDQRIVTRVSTWYTVGKFIGRINKALRGDADGLTAEYREMRAALATLPGIIGGNKVDSSHFARFGEGAALARYVALKDGEDGEPIVRDAWLAKTGKHGHAGYASREDALAHVKSGASGGRYLLVPLAGKRVGDVGCMYAFRDLLECLLGATQIATLETAAEGRAALAAAREEAAKLGMTVSQARRVASARKTLREAGQL